MKKITLLAAAISLLAACGGSEPGSVDLTGAGASFPYPMYSKWFDEYGMQNANVRVNYQSLGSGAGIRQVTDGTVDFGATDGPMTAEQLSDFSTAQSTSIMHFPTVLGAVVPTYNLEGVDATLNFTGEALAGIFLGEITHWDDPAIAEANPDVTLPAEEIVVVHRSDGSGTTFIFTDFLSKVSQAWAAGPGSATAISWPVGLGGRGNEGVTGLVKQTPNSIGYVEMIYALQNDMPSATVQNSAGNFITASLDTVTAAADGVEMPEDFRVSITNPGGEQAYPIASFTWLLVPEQIEDPGKRDAMIAFLEWMLDEGQTMTPALEYAPLPASVVEKELAAIARIH